MIYKLILIPLNKRNKLSHIHLLLGGFAKVCFGYIQVMPHAKKNENDETTTRQLGNFL